MEKSLNPKTKFQNVEGETCHRGAEGTEGKKKVLATENQLWLGIFLQIFTFFHLLSVIGYYKKR